MYSFEFVSFTDPALKTNIREQLSNNKSLHFSEFESTNIYNLKPKKSPELVVQKNRSSLPISTTIPTKQQVKSPCRQVSRIPQVIKPSSKSNVELSPQHKKAKPSQIPKVNFNGSGGGGVGGPFVNIANAQKESPTNQPQSAPPFTKARCEAYMMTGDLMLNLSRTPQSSNLIATHSKKVGFILPNINRYLRRQKLKTSLFQVDSLRDSPNRNAARANGALAPRASGESTPSSSPSPSHSEASSGESVSSSKRKTNTRATRSTTQFKEHLLSNNSNSNYSSDKKFHQDSLINDTLVLCEDIERDEERYFHNEVDIHVDDTAAENNEIIEDEDDDQSTNYDIDLNSVTQSKSHKIKSNQQYSMQYHKKYYKQSSSDVVDCLPHHNLLNQQISITSSSSSTTARSDNLSTPDETGSFSVPTSPISLSTPLLDVKETAISVPTSPEQSSTQGESGEGVIRRQHNGVIRKCDASGFRTSKSEDHLQQVQREGGVGAVIPIDIDEDVNSSLNTLLDTRQDSEDSQVSFFRRCLFATKI